ncbi:MAG: pantetheine-phosphate adenylyltransferase [Clostridia bacterium]|nr:pantetheine-phosphate adenylyltransferase [Clostridia bacterium]
MNRTALFAGSFDPYTNGHHSIVRKAAGLFDRVVVLIGVNVQKRRSFDATAMRDAIARAVADDGLDNVSVVCYDGVVADYCAAHGIRWYVRGIRNHLDYNYEEGIAQVNRLINPALETLYLRADDAVLSSSMIRELIAFHKDVSDYVPDAVREVVQQKH